MRSDLPEDNNLEVALDAFWNVAYQQGQEQRGHDDEEGTAQKAEDDLRSAIAAIAASRIRSCLLDKPEAVEGEATPSPQSGVVGVEAALKSILQTVDDKSLDLKSVRIRVWGFAKNALNQLEGSNNV